MTFRSLGVLAATLLCACALIGAGCGGAETTLTTYLVDTGVTTTTESPAETAVTTESVQFYPVTVDGKWGCIDNTGTIKIEPAFDQAYCAFSEGLAPVDPTKGYPDRFGYIDMNGDWVIEPQFASAGQFFEGMAEVGTQDQGDGGKWGSIDTSGAP